MSSLFFCFRTNEGMGSTEESYAQSGLYSVVSDSNSEFFGRIRCASSITKDGTGTQLLACYFRSAYNSYPPKVPTPSFPLAVTLFLNDGGNSIRYDFVLDNLSDSFVFPSPFPHYSLSYPSFTVFYGSVPCEPIQATHYQIRWEFDRIVTLDSDGNSGNYYLSPIFSIPAGGVDDVVHRFAGFLAPYVSSRIRFCDASGNIRPYRGSGYIAHVLNADGSGYIFGGSPFSASSPDVLYTAVTALTQSLADGDGTTSVNTLVSFSASDEILDGDCETIEPPGDDDDDEVELPEGEDPPDGEDPPEKKEGEKGKRKDDPDSVETCECYDIINQRLTDINNNIAILNDNILEQMQVHNDTFAILITKMQEWTRYLSNQWREIMLEKNKFDDLRQKRFKQFLTSDSGEKIADSVQRATDALYVSHSGSAHDGDSVADLHNSVFHSSINEDMSITDAIENIEPVTIENEYRTQSHRVIDNIDSTQNL